MSLSNLIRGKGGQAIIATATPATFATHESEKEGTVASVATVAVAPSPQGQVVASGVSGIYGTVLRVDVLESDSHAVAASPIESVALEKLLPLTACEEIAIRECLKQVGETRPDAIAEVIALCQSDAGARDYFKAWAAEDSCQNTQEAVVLDDDRRTCHQCRNLAGRRCQAAKRGEIIASRNYEPIPNLLRRCEAYIPGGNDIDQRPALERWPNLA